MEKGSNGVLAFLDTLLQRNQGNIFVLIYRKPKDTDQYLHYSCHHQRSCKESVVFSVFNTSHSIITNKDDLTKENAKINKVLRANGCQEIIISKIFEKSFCQSQQQTEATDVQEKEIRININFPYIEGTSEKLQCIDRSQKIGSTFYPEKTLHKLLCKPKY